MIIAVHVTPRASRTELVGAQHGELRVRVTAAPVGGGANEAALTFLAKRLGVSRSRLAILSGASARHKRLRVRGLTCADIEGSLAVDL